MLTFGALVCFFFPFVASVNNLASAAQALVSCLCLYVVPFICGTVLLLAAYAPQVLP